MFLANVTKCVLKLDKKVIVGDAALRSGFDTYLSPEERASVVIQVYSAETSLSHIFSAGHRVGVFVCFCSCVYICCAGRVCV
jgi:hypothetical protein